MSKETINEADVGSDESGLIPEEDSVPEDNGSDVDELPAEYVKDLSLLDQCLAGKPDVFKSKVINIMLRRKISANDPIFLLLLATGELEEILVNTPLGVAATLEEFNEELENLFQQYFGGNKAVDRFEEAIAREQAAIAEAALELIKATRKEQFYGSLGAISRAIAPALAGVFLSVGLGVIGTLQYQKLMGRSLITAGKLTVEHYNALEWAESAEGKLAQNIMEWNKGYIGKACEADAQAMGIGLTVNGRKTTKGFCVLYVKPPNQRK